ncbi:hypothetical protein [Glycomyces harbinensis]|uniref:Uncharacterized protein n=1 Tax=Glycomyces harbinensis TaxID=58114 RepID=A0A1G6Z9X8_9ACTN|nr:hypothetical protein [Glycomyces harbinensis]SDD99093.1 hypothetical protein SAMN05216270_110122 [Glycomyces harbinensis]
MTATDATVTALLSELGDSWETVEKITAARERFIDGIPDWRLPAAYGVATVDGGSGIVFARANVGVHPLPAVVMATTLGHRSGSGSYFLDARTLSRAIRLLAPAEACTAYEHPNLATWREVHKTVEDGGAAVAVFLHDLDYQGEDPAVVALQDIALQSQ